MAEVNTTEKKTKVRSNSTANGTYGLAFIGTLIYFIEHATSFGDGVLGFFKAIFWPAFLIYHLLEHLGL